VLKLAECVFHVKAGQVIVSGTLVRHADRVR